MFVSGAVFVIVIVSASVRETVIPVPLANLTASLVESLPTRFKLAPPVVALAFCVYVVPGLVLANVIVLASVLTILIPLPLANFIVSVVASLPVRLKLAPPVVVVASIA